MTKPKETRAYVLHLRYDIYQHLVEGASYKDEMSEKKSKLTNGQQFLTWTCSYPIEHFLGRFHKAIALNTKNGQFRTLGTLGYNSVFSVNSLPIHLDLWV